MYDNKHISFKDLINEIGNYNPYLIEDNFIEIDYYINPFKLYKHLSNLQNLFEIHKETNLRIKLINTLSQFLFGEIQPNTKINFQFFTLDENLSEKTENILDLQLEIISILIKNIKSISIKEEKIVSDLNKSINNYRMSHENIIFREILNLYEKSNKLEGFNKIKFYILFIIKGNNKFIIDNLFQILQKSIKEKIFMNKNFIINYKEIDPSNIQRLEFLKKLRDLIKVSTDFILNYVNYNEDKFIKDFNLKWNNLLSQNLHGLEQYIYDKFNNNKKKKKKNNKKNNINNKKLSSEEKNHKIIEEKKENKKISNNKINNGNVINIFHYFTDSGKNKNLEIENIKLKNEIKNLNKKVETLSEKVEYLCNEIEKLKTKQ